MKTRIAFLCAALLFAASALAQQVQPLERIVAVVDEDVILQSELNRAVANILAQYAGLGRARCSNARCSNA
jgi:peptidyl-prolyl cis-trans isomerase SurA